MDDEQLHYYTEVVIELWTAYQHRKFNLSNLGGGDSRVGIDHISWEAGEFLNRVKNAEEEGYWWDGGWIDAVWCWAKWAVQRWMDVDQPPFEVTVFMEPKED